MPSIQTEIDVLMRKLNQVSDRARRDSQKALGEGAKPLIAAIKAAAPVSDGVHYRKGEMRIAYHPGNLRRGIKKLIFRRSPAVFVGPKLDKTASAVEYKGNKVDAYYAHFVEFGTVNQPPRPFVRPAAAAVGPAAINIAAKALKREIEKYTKTAFR